MESVVSQFGCKIGLRLRHKHAAAKSTPLFVSSESIFRTLIAESELYIGLSPILGLTY